MAIIPISARQVTDILTEHYWSDKQWYQFWLAKEYRLFVISYDDGSGELYRVRIKK